MPKPLEVNSKNENACSTFCIVRAGDEQAFSAAPSFSLKNRVVRAVWAGVWMVLARWTPPSFRLWRVFLLRVFGAKVAWSANIYSSVSIWYPPHLTMEHRAALGPGVVCYCVAPVFIGERAVISQRSHICTGTHDFDRSTFQLYALPVRVGAQAWIAAEAFVGPGVVMGEGAVLGARAVATRDLEPWSVYVGSPARCVRPRNKF